jgi:hypothetical protein
LSCFVPPPPPAGLGEGFVCCVSLAASAEGSVVCTASSAVLRTLVLTEGSVLGQLLACDELASPLLPAAAAAALLDDPPPAPPLPLPAVALPLLFFCLPCGAPHETHHAVSGKSNGNAASLSPPKCNAMEPGVWARVERAAPSSSPPPRALPPRSAPPPCGPPTRSPRRCVV